MTVRLWEAETGKFIGELKGHKASVLSATFSRDNKHIVTASEDKTARLWEVETRKPFGLKKFASVQQIQDFIKQAKGDAPRCLTPAQREEFFLDPEQPPAWCIDMKKWPYDRPGWLTGTQAGGNPPLPSK